MANPQKGEIEFEIGGKPYIFLLGSYALAKLEQKFSGKPWPQIFQDAKNNWGVATSLAVFHCGLLLHHEPMTEKEASVLLDELTAEVFMQRLGDTWKLQFGEGEARPPEAAAKTTNGIGNSLSANG